MSAHQRIRVFLAERPRVLSERDGRGCRKSVHPRKSYYAGTHLRRPALSRLFYGATHLRHVGFLASALPCPAADSISFPRPGLRQALREIFGPGLSARFEALGGFAAAVPQAVASLPRLGAGGLADVAGPNGAQVEHLALGVGHPQLAGEGVGPERPWVLQRLVGGGVYNVIANQRHTSRRPSAQVSVDRVGVSADTHAPNGLRDMKQVQFRVVGVERAAMPRVDDTLQFTQPVRTRVIETTTTLAARGPCFALNRCEHYHGGESEFEAARSRIL
jgi:hypothetical protein